MCGSEDYARFNPEVIEEILRHKWLESEKAGYDIGSRKAAEDWIAHHYEDWLRHRLAKERGRHKPDNGLSC